MGSTYLDLTNRVLRRLNEVEISSSEFASVRGVHAMAKDAVLDVVREINSQKFEWPFNLAVGSQTLTVADEDYDWPADFRSADWNSFYIENDGTLNTATRQLGEISKDEYFRLYRDADLDSGATGRGLPQFVFDLGDGGYGVSPSPDRAYILKFRYFINTIDLVTYDDTTTIPTEYDHVVTDGAMKHLYQFMDNPERAAKATQDFNRGLGFMTYNLIAKDPYAYVTMANVGGQPKGVNLVGFF